MSAPDGRKGRRIAGAGCGAILGVVGLTLGAYLAWAYHLPPAPVQPSPPVRNGYSLLMAAAARVHAKYLLGDLDHVSRSKLEASVRANHTSVRALQKALGLACVVPDTEGLPGSAAANSLGAVVNVGQCLATEGVNASRNGRYAAAVDYGLDCVELSARLTHGPFLAYLMGRACAATGRQYAIPAITRLTGAEAQALGRRMDRILSEAVPPAEQMEANRRVQLRVCRASLRAEPQPADLLSGSLDDRAGALSGVWSGLRYPASTCCRACDRYYGEVIGELRKPYPSRHMPEPPRLPSFRADLEPQAELWSGLSEDFAREETFQHLFRLRLALQEFHADNGQYPTSLQEISTCVPATVLTDPYTGQPLHYSQELGGYRLYSIGPDGKDDGGQLIRRDGWLTLAPQGDVVAWVRADGTSPLF